MGKHETSYARVERDLYPTRELWVVEALAQHLNVADKTVWECAAGDGHMVKSLRTVGAARVIATDILQRGFPLDAVFDFTSDRNLKLPHIDLTITNPAFGQGNRLAVKFIEAGLRRGGTLALLLPIDFDSAKNRAHLFSECPSFLCKIVLRRRIVWFENFDAKGRQKAPKENHCWYIWSTPVLRIPNRPVVLYGPMRADP